MSSNNGWTQLGDDIRDMVDSAVNSGDFRKLNENISRTVLEGLEGLENLGSTIRKNMGADGMQGQGFGSTGQAGPGNAGFGNGGPGNAGAGNGGPGNAGTGQWNAGRGGAGNRGGQWNTGRGQAGPGNAGAGQWSAGPGSTGQWNAGRSVDGNGYGRNVQNAGSQIYRTVSDNIKSAVNNVNRNLAQSSLFVKTTGTHAGGTALMAVGYTAAGAIALTILILMIVGFMEGGAFGVWVAAGILAVFLAGSCMMAWKGTSLLGRVRRFRKYVEGLQGRTYCSVKELADHLGKSEKYVRKDLQKLIQKGWFKQGHMDRLGTCLIVSNETYMQYEQSQKQLELRQQQEQKNREETEGLSEEVKEMIRTGRTYIEKISRSNDAIPGEEISRKISYMQTVVEKIFQRVKEYPECADDLRKFMDYYLPTTVKLLDAYEELDSQPVQGDNIRNGKLEIEKTLDTLNVAFEKLLDSLFEDTAWDVSTDISVLHTMLAQEGLTEAQLKAGQ